MGLNCVSTLFLNPDKYEEIKDIVNQASESQLLNHNNIAH